MAVTPVTRHCRGIRAPASEHCSHPRPTVSTGADARGMGPGSLLLGEGLAGWTKRRALVKGSRVCWTRKLRQTVMVWVGPTQKKVEPLETQTPWLSLQPPGEHPGFLSAQEPSSSTGSAASVLCDLE